MQLDPHQHFRQMIDEAMAAGPSMDPSLRQHLDSCSACQEYLSANARVVAALGGFAFAVNPGQQARIFAALEQRAQQLEPMIIRRKRLGLACLAAVALTVVGSLFDLQFGGWLAAIFHFPGWQVRDEMLTFWIVPSLCPLLLLPLLPLLLARHERAL